MSHIDPDDLAMIALSPAATTDAQRAHLAGCVECSREERAFARTIELGRTGDVGALMTPPSAVWERIHDELQLSAAVAEPTATEPAPTVAPPLSASAVVPIGTRPRRRLWPLLVAAAAVGVVGGLAVGTLVPAGTEAVTVVARAVLDPLPGQEATGEALVEETANGRRDVVITLDGDAVTATPGDGSLREVWLLTADASGLVSLGFLDGSDGRFVIPGDIDLGQYPVVDVSVEDVDGDPTHSGNSVVRGELRAS